MKQLEFTLISNGKIPCAFGFDAYEAAKEIVSHYDKDALVLISLRQLDDFLNETDQFCWIEIRRATKYILILQAYWLAGYHLRIPTM